MKKLFFLILILVFSVWAGIQIQRDPGYILIAYHTWTIEMPVWTGILLILISFLIFYSLLRLLGATGSLGIRIRAWLIRRRKRRSRNRTSQGLIELAEGRWEDAEANLLKAAISSETPLINYLAAACAAQEQHAYERRDDYLRLAHQSTPDAEVAIGVVQAQLQLNHQQWEHALATLRRMLELAPKHRHVLKLLKETYVQLHDWPHLAELLPQLKKNKAINSAEAEVLQRAIYQAELLAAANQQDLVALRAVWHKMPRELQFDKQLIKIYVAALLQQQQSAEAEKILRAAIEKDWDNELIAWYGLTISDNPGKQLALIEGWLKEQPENPALLLTAGRLCLRNQLWGKAKTYLEFSLQLEPKVETYLLLGELLAQLNDQEASVAMYHKGLHLAAAIQAPKDVDQKILMLK